MAPSLTDLKIRALPYSTNGQRDYVDPSLKGFSLRVGKHTKTFMLLVRKGGRRSRVKIGLYPDNSLSKARERARDVLAQQRVSQSETPAISFKDALETFFRAHCATRQRPKTQKECRRLLTLHFSDLAHKRMDAIKPSDLAALLDAMLDTPGERRNAFVWLRTFFAWAYKRGYVERNPIHRIDRPVRSPPRERVLSDAELTAIWAALPQKDYGQVLRLCILTGQRIGQWLNFKPEFSNGLTVTWPGAYMKTGRPHTIPLAPMAAALIPSRPFVCAKGSWNKTLSVVRVFGTTGWVK